MQPTAGQGDDSLAAELGLLDEKEMEKPTVDAETMIEETVEEVPERGTKRDADALESAAKKQKTERFDEEAAFNA